MIRAHNLTISYSDLLFKELSFILGNQEKVGLVGLNGSGKTTLLRIIKGLELADAGKIEVQNEVISYLPQQYSFEEDLLVGIYLESLVEDLKTEMYKVNKVLRRLNFEVDMFQEIKTLSEGQKMKLFLTKLLMEEPTILLLDEPTNHLDIKGILELEQFIKSFEGICIIISHDREFLNNTINTVFEIDEKTLHVYTGNYDDYLVQKADYLEKRKTQYYLQEVKRQQLLDLIKKSQKISDGKRRSKAMSAAEHRLEREVLRIEIDDYKEQKIKGLKLNGFVHNNKTVLKIKDLDFSYNPNKALFNKANFEMFGKERVWFYGPNGIGKTTFVKLVLKHLTPDSGIADIGVGLKYVYFSQDQSHLDMNSTVEDYFLHNTNVSYNSSFGVLDRFLFPKELRTSKIGKLSPGQRARLSFAIFSMKEYDFMILDEPTNHLDIRSKEVIEDALRDFKGAILLISHDRYFVDSVGYNKTLTIEGGKLK